MTSPPTVRLWPEGTAPPARDDVELTELGLPTEAALAAPVADDNCSGEPVPPLAAALPDHVAERPVYISALLDARVTSPRSYLLTRERELVLDAIDTRRAQEVAFAEYDEALESFDVAPSDRADSVALIGRQRAHAYWHWWADVIPRIWLLETYGGPEAQGLPLALPRPASFQQDTIDLLGYGERVLPLRRGVHRFAKVVFTPGMTTTHTSYPSALMAPFAAWVRERILGSPAPAGEPTRIFVGRRDVARPKRKVVNEDEVRAHLAGRGFTCIDGSELSIREQAELFSRADVVVGPHGGGLTNLLFCRPGTQVVELFPASGARPLSCYRVAASHLRLPYTRMVFATADAPRFGTSEKQQALNDSMVVDIDALDRRLDRVGEDAERAGRRRDRRRRRARSRRRARGAATAFAPTPEAVAALAELPRAERNEQLIEAARAGAFDFLDFGTHKAGGLRLGESLGGRRGLGVEFEDAKVLNTLRGGDAVWSGDVADFPLTEPAFGFGICRHVLEHLPDLGVVRTVLERMSAACRDYLYVEGPDFTTERMLEPLGLTMAHTTTTVHTCHVTAEDVIAILGELGFTRTLVGGKLRIRDSSNVWVHAAGAPANRSKWSDADLPKPGERFDPPIYRDFVLLADVSSEHYDLEGLVERLPRARFGLEAR